MRLKYDDIMNEAFLQYVWQYQLFDMEELCTTAGDPLQIVTPGVLNRDAGPDFKGAVIRIGDIVWAGDVEIHVRSSDWYRHHHEDDEKYKMVTLHVVYEHDREVERLPGELYPTFEIRGRVLPDMYERYQELVGTLDELPCQSFLPDMSLLTIRSQMESVLMERLLRKQSQVRETVSQCHGDWQEALYRHLAVGFGMKTNADAFELLAKSLPYKIISRHTESVLQVQALVFGQAGMLEVAQGDDHYRMLKAEYDYLRYKYQLTPIATYHWNLLRLRPSNFPCIRLSQFATLLYEIPDLWSELTHRSDMAYWWRRFAVSADAYWEHHYHFNKETSIHHVALGEASIALLFINIVIPVLFSYWHFQGDEEKMELALDMLGEIPFEDNRVTRRFATTAFPQEHASDSQALIELYTRYCQPRRCLECAIGDCIVKSSKNL